VKKGVLTILKEENVIDGAQDTGHRTQDETCVGALCPVPGASVIPRRYFSGGFESAMLQKVVSTGLLVAALSGLSPDARALAQDATNPKGDMVRVAAGVQDVGKGADGDYLAASYSEGVKAGSVDREESASSSESAMLSQSHLRDLMVKTMILAGRSRQLYKFLCKTDLATVRKLLDYPDTKRTMYWGGVRNMAVEALEKEKMNKGSESFWDY